MDGTIVCAGDGGVRCTGKRVTRAPRADTNFSEVFWLCLLVCDLMIGGSIDDAVCKLT